MTSNEFGPLAEDVYRTKHAMGKENWPGICRRVTKNVLGAVSTPKNTHKAITKAICDRKFLPAGRHLYGAGRPVHQLNNCFLMLAEDSREGWAKLYGRVAMALMTGGGVGVEYSKIRESGASVRRTGGVASGPIPLMQAVNEIGRASVQGGGRRAAMWAGLNWKHPDVMEFMQQKNWNAHQRAAKAENYSAPAPMDMTNISVGLDADFFKAIKNKRHSQHNWALQVYKVAIRGMCESGEPGFSVNFSDEIARNPCCEVVSADSDDVCCLGSINMARISSLKEMQEIVQLGIIYLLASTVYSDLPYPKVDQVRSKNRRLGLGLMGLHEWLLQRGKAYGPDDELAKYLEVYAAVSTLTAQEYAKKWKLSTPIATRAIAPTGTISIIAETTSGLEPIFCTAYRRRYLKDRVWTYRYIVDPTAKRLIEQGIPEEKIEDAFALARVPERRLAFQAFCQKYVDMAISSTVNLPAWGDLWNSEVSLDHFGKVVLEYLPQLKGLTVYPNGARAGQPLEPVDYHEAQKKGEEAVSEMLDSCTLRGGNCGDA